MLYPLKFQPIYKDKIWGGQKLVKLLGKQAENLPNCGESWEISGVEGNISHVINGNISGKGLDALIRKYRQDLVGEHVYNTFGDEFPLLIKFIDANDDLSIQVHPNDELAKLRNEIRGKTEMWYILQADEGSKLISGFNKLITKDEYLDYFNAGKLKDILCETEVYANDVFYLPAGRVHTIGKGILLAEIQQTSDVTYRIYDFGRVDAYGNKRELHVDQALDAIDYNYVNNPKTKYDLNSINQPTLLLKSPYFTTNRMVLHEIMNIDYKNLDSFVIYICVEGNALVGYNDKKYFLGLGECMLIPACISSLEIIPSPNCTLLETYVEQ